MSRLYRPIADGITVELAAGLVLETAGGRIRLAGELDLMGSQGFLDFLSELDGDIEVDCSELTFIDTAGLRVLEETHLACEAAGTHLSLIDPPLCVRRLVLLSGLDGLFEIRDGSRS